MAMFACGKVSLIWIVYPFQLPLPLPISMYSFIYLFISIDIQWIIWSNGNVQPYSNRMALSRHMINRWMRPLQRQAQHWQPQNTINAEILAIRMKFCCTDVNVNFVYWMGRVKSGDFLNIRNWSTIEWIAIKINKHNIQLSFFYFHHLPITSDFRR